MKKNYKCSICGRQGVKLWRPYMGTEPLICADCAEKRQSSLMYNEYAWKKDGDCYIGNFTGKKLPLPRWSVDEKGKVPSYDGPDPTGSFKPQTDQLIVDLQDVSKAYASGKTTMIPAVPNKFGEFWGYTSVPEQYRIWWEELPTK